MTKCKYLFYLILLATPFTSLAQESKVQGKENKHSGYNIELFRGCKECRHSEGTCNAIIKSLQVYQDNDSIAIEIFKKEYEITNMRLYQKEWLSKKNYIDIIQYFSLDENKKYYCRLKSFKQNDPVLFDLR